MTRLLALRGLALGTFVLLATATALAQTPTPSQGAASNPSSGSLQEVIVTAQFRQENVQTTPLAITAVNAETLAARGQTSITEVTQDVPSLLLSGETGAFGPSMAAFIRGIGQADLDPALEPGVGIYIDDVYFGTLTGSIFDLLDLDRVEVLRGPQGTLEGMNSEGGAVKLFSKKPDSTESMSFDLLGGSRNHVELRAGTNFAITDNLFVRLSGVGNHQDGYVTRYDFGCANPSFAATDVNGVAGTYSVAPGFLAQTTNCVLGREGGIGYAAGRVAVRFIPSDTLEFNLIGDLANTSQEAPPETLGYAGPGPLEGNASAAVTTNVPPPIGAALALPTTNGHLLLYNQADVPAMIPSNFYATYANFCTPVEPPPFPTPAYCVNPNTKVENWGVSLTTDWKISEHLSLRNILADRGYEANWVHDNDVSTWGIDLGAESMGHHQFSEELRLSGGWGKFLDWTVGGYYFRELTVYFGHEDITDVVLPGFFNFYQNDPVQAHDKAGFLHTTFHLTPKLDLIFGARYTAQDKTYHYVRLNPEGTTGGSAAIVSALNGASSQYAATRWDWRANLDYHFTDDIMVYGQFSTGFKGGGVDPRPFYVQQAIQFNPESLSTYEVGLKTSWFNNHLRANIDGYFSQYRNIQLVLDNCSNVPAIKAASAAADFNFGFPCALPYNAGAGHQKGVEFESQLRFGGLQIDANFSYLKFNYVSVDPSTGVSLGMVTPFTPTWTGGGGAQYTFQVGDTGTFTARIDGSTRSGVWTAAVNGPYNRLAGYTIYNAHLTWEAPKGNWQIAALAKNLTAKKYVINNFDTVALGGGAVVLSPGPPLDLGVEIKHTM